MPLRDYMLAVGKGWARRQGAQRQDGRISVGSFKVPAGLTSMHMSDRFSERTTYDPKTGTVVWSGEKLILTPITEGGDEDR